MKHLIALVLLFGVLALGPCKVGLAQTGSEEGSMESAGRTGTEGGTQAGEIWGILAQPALRALKAACETGLVPLTRQVQRVVLEAVEKPAPRV